ncbi:MAG: DUF3800 domain-containing protein, partial [Alphaproteobacteria bacterium]|nr:DUF3800 domain-containing protein [Alphaproteobacteria bacterium]
MTNIDPGFPVFVLCSILCKKDDFSAQIDTGFDQLKSDLWGTNNVHFHSRDIRKCEKEFQILFDLDIKRQFYERLNDCISSSDYTIIASGIKKKDYAKRYGVLNDVYSISLTFIIERTIFYLDDQDDVGDLYILAEARGKEEDKLLRDHMRKIYNRGTFYVNNQRLRERIKSFKFYKKTDNHNGLQLA